MKAKRGGDAAGRIAVGRIHHQVRADVVRIQVTHLILEFHESGIAPEFHTGFVPLADGI